MTNYLLGIINKEHNLLSFGFGTEDVGEFFDHDFSKKKEYLCFSIKNKGSLHLL